MAREILDIIEEMGFETIGSCDASKLKVSEQVREMCKVNTCGQWDKTWACPPVCGDLDHYRQLLSEKSRCYVFETWGELEDEFDFETMMELSNTHNQRTNKVTLALSKEHPEALVLGAGKCTLCPECTYPDEPCRHPEIVHTAMEAAGLVVADVCRAADIPYNHGKGTMSYVSCVLV